MFVELNAQFLKNKYFQNSSMSFTNRVSTRHLREQHIHKLLAYQHELPPLPVPKLSETLNLFLKTVEPLCSAQEIAEAQTLCDELLNSNDVS